MSETVDETTEPEPVEPEPEPEPDAEPDPADDDDETPEQDPEPEPEPQGLTEKQVEQRFEKIANESRRHADRIGAILEEDANDLHECPLCSHFIPGFVYPQPAPEEIVAKVRPYLGLPDLSELKPDRKTARCPDCDGRGIVAVDCFVAGNVVRKCDDCNGAGYIVVATGKPPAQAQTEQNGSGEAPLFDGVNPDDPAVSDLRSRGFTVIPPMHLPTTPTTVTTG